MIIAAEGVTFGYRRSAPIVENLSAGVRAGEMVALTGPSGRGKSTLLYLLAGLLTPWSGEVRLNDRPLAAMPDFLRSRLRARSFGFVFQDAALDARRTVLDAVLEPTLYAGLSPAAYTERAMDLLERMGVSLRPSARPGEISGGQAQRVALCRALLLEPAVICADEPTGNLDTASAQVVLATMADAAAAGSAVLIATHDDRVIERCTRTVRL
ncbi:ABC transporter ATP-binding protein [Micromonosporaceae bacterium DT55]|uniref:ABC transporter ATP-binding protein n=1 Tax=Melissospora conviva TaxID=3388432 RepID=UPI003C190137